MVRFTVEIELPDDDPAARVRIEALCRGSGWRLMGIHKSTDPPCPQCGEPMDWDRDLATYVCHHPA